MPPPRSLRRKRPRRCRKRPALPPTLLASRSRTRCKLGLAPPNLREWHITLDFENLTQLDGAFGRVSTRSDPVESFHHAVNSKVQDVYFALYRDFPDPSRVTGQEKF